MFAVEHPLDLPLAAREQEHTYGGVYSWNDTKRIKDYRKVAENAKGAKKGK